VPALPGAFIKAPHLRHGRSLIITQLPNADPDTAEIDSAVPSQVLNGYRTNMLLEKGLSGKACWGVNGVPEGPSIVRVGDRVHVMARFDERAC
jgi:uncharacterized protein YcbX